MKLPIRFVQGMLIVFFGGALVACGDDVVKKETNQLSETVVDTLDIYKSPTCGCCGDWIEHIEENDFSTKVHHPDDLSLIKNQLGIKPNYQSCHTAVSKDGFVFEGHIPANIMSRFLAAPPTDALGLAVPGMPIGSPGMEMGDRHDDYDVLLLKKDGSSEVYDHITAMN